MRAPALWMAALVLLTAACGDSPASAPAELVNAPQTAAGPAGAVFPVLTGRVVDEAGLLTPAEEARLTAELEALERRTTDQLVIVTVPSLGGLTIEAFGLGLGNHWRIGQEDKDNGVLIIVVPAERQVRIEVGYGLEAILTNARAAEIIRRDMLPRLREGRWYPAVEAGTREIVATLVAHKEEERRGRP